MAGVTNTSKFDSPVVLTASGFLGPTSSPNVGAKPAGTGRSFLTLPLKDMDYKSGRWLRIDAFRLQVTPTPIQGGDFPVVHAMPGVTGAAGNLNAGSVRGIQTGFFLNAALRLGEWEIAEDVPLPMFSPRSQVASERELSQIGGEGGTYYPRRSANHYTIPLGAPLFVPPSYVPSIVLRRPGDGTPYHHAYDTADVTNAITGMQVEFAAVGARVKEPSKEERKALKVPWFDIFRVVNEDAQWPQGTSRSQNYTTSREQQLRNNFKRDLYVSRLMGRILATPFLEPRDADVEDRKFPHGFDGLLNYCAAGSDSNELHGGFNPLLEITDSSKHKVVNQCNWRNAFAPQLNAFRTGVWCLKPLERLIARVQIPDVPLAVSEYPNPLAQRYFSILNRLYVGISGWREERY